VALLVSAVLGLMVGSSGAAPTDVLAALWSADDPALRHIVLGLRLPAIALAAAVGASLAGAGVVTQAMLRNPLADPYVLGVSGGAAVGVAAASLIAPASLRMAAVPLAALAGSLGALALLHALASRLGAAARDTTASLLLAGVVFNSLASALVLLLHTVLAPNRSHELLFALVGAISPARLTLALAVVLGVSTLVALGWLLRSAHRVNLLALGDDAAAALGVDVARERPALLATVSVVVACAVSAAGMIGFVGLVVPHALRRVVGSDVRLLLPASLLAGASFVVLCDAAARAAFGPFGAVLPVGAVTALVGAPLFVVLLARGAGRGGDA
jgi:iron complex transport system permease protein